MTPAVVAVASASAGILVGARVSPRTAKASAKQRKAALIAEKQRLREGLSRRDLWDDEERAAEAAALDSEIAIWIAVHRLEPRTAAQIHGVCKIPSDAALDFIRGNHETDPRIKPEEETRDATTH